jgi:glycosyltransferase involved in cell wall biosynthesis
METHTLHLATLLEQRGHDVTIRPIGRGIYETRPELRSARFAVRPMDRSESARPLGIVDWLAALSPVAGDVCILAKNYWDQGGPAFNLAARIHFTRVLYIEHVAPGRTPRRKVEWTWPRLVPPGLRWKTQRYLRGRLQTLGVEKVVCVSDEVRSALWDECGFPLHKSLTIRNGVDTSRYRPDEEHRRAARLAWGVPGNAIVCGTVTRLDNRAKRLDMTLELFARARAAQPDLPLWCVLVGDGPDRKMLEEVAAALGIADRVRFAPFTPRPWEAYPGLDIFLLTSRFEAISLALMEAMACARYAIAVSVGGVPEVLSRPDVGTLVPDGDLPALGDALIAAALLSPEERATVGARARTWISQNFEAHASYDRVAAVVEGVTEGDRSGALQHHGRGATEAMHR